jgi:hypothetical protein
MILTSLFFGANIHNVATISFVFYLNFWVKFWKNWPNFQNHKTEKKTMVLIYKP